MHEGYHIMKTIKPHWIVHSLINVVLCVLDFLLSPQFHLLTQISIPLCVCLATGISAAFQHARPPLGTDALLPGSLQQ